MENHEYLIGKILGDRYKIEAIVGQGGMSVVMKAVDMTSSAEVTIKLLNVQGNEAHNAVERFINEAKAVSMLSHPNIVSVSDVVLEGPDMFIVMEYIKGITLKEYLDQKGRLEWREAVHYVNQVLAALAHAHEKGVVHRDIKPENVMLQSDGTIKVIDFGIAKLPDSKSLTVIDKAIGTVNYISPEQASGNGSTEKSDIYSTGIMLYELVTGQLPFVSASSVSVAMMHVSSEPAMPSSICDSIPKGLEQIIIKSMMKNPDNRFGSANAMNKALSYILAYPETVFKSTAVGPDGKPILGTGAVGVVGGSNTVITHEISPGNDDENTVPPFYGASITDNDITDDEEDEEEDDEFSYVKPAKSSMFPIILGITLAFFTILLFFGLAAWNNTIGDGADIRNSISEIVNPTKPRDTEENSIRVPAVEGLKYSPELEEKLTAAGFNVTKKEAANEKVAEGLIISQEPEANYLMKKNPDGIDLTIIISKRPKIILDDYYNYPAIDVKNTLDKSGIKTNIVDENSETVIKGSIIRTEPRSGAELLEGDTVRLVVSSGSIVIGTVKTVPYVVNSTKKEAEARFNTDKIKYTIAEKYSDDYDAGVVCETLPEGGTEIDISSRVTIYISKGPDPTPVPIPGDLLGKSFEEAKNDILAGKIKNVSKAEEFSEEYPIGVVCRVSPASGTPVDRNSTVTLFISKGPDDSPVSIPSVIGIELENAINILTEKGIKTISIIEEFSEIYEPGKICAVSPSQGTTIKKTDKITLSVSKGPDDSPILLPDSLVGRTPEEVAMLLSGLEIAFNMVEAFSDKYDPGLVCAISHAEGSTVKKNDVVTVYISKGIDPSAIPSDDTDDPASDDDSDSNASGSDDSEKPDDSTSQESSEGKDQQKPSDDTLDTPDTTDTTDKSEASDSTENSDTTDTSEKEDTPGSTSEATEPDNSDAVTDTEKEQENTDAENVTPSTGSGDTTENNDEDSVPATEPEYSQTDTEA